MNVEVVADDLAAEQQALDDVLAPVDPDRWSTATASPGWSVADQIGHLTYFDGVAALAITDPGAFQETVAAMLHAAAAGGAGAGDDYVLAEARSREPAELLVAWRANRRRLQDAAATLGDDDRIAWYGPSMGAKSFLTARLMECWAHGQDIVDALGLDRPDTDRLRHIAQIGFLTRGWTYVNRGLDPPTTSVRVEFTGPGGDEWTFGPEGADDTVSGPAVDFCLVVTQRRHVDDTALEFGAVARDWLEKAQAFAGPASDGPAPASR